MTTTFPFREGGSQGGGLKKWRWKVGVGLKWRNALYDLNNVIEKKVGFTIILVNTVDRVIAPIFKRRFTCTYMIFILIIM